MKKVYIAVALLVVAVLCWNHLGLTVSLSKPSTVVSRSGTTT